MCHDAANGGKYKKASLTSYQIPFFLATLETTQECWKGHRSAGENTGVLERTQERIHQEEWKERTREEWVYERKAAHSGGASRKTDAGLRLQGCSEHGYGSVWERMKGNVWEQEALQRQHALSREEKREMTVLQYQVVRQGKAGASCTQSGDQPEYLPVEAMDSPQSSLFFLVAASGAGRSALKHRTVANNTQVHGHRLPQVGLAGT
ncbi:MAG: hypothetical protein J3Q66DRAFT_401137 [Benniella sp.]|nr:MAG: hypothetical protein J3Q66DRAFT_401137 [Benniella sp.]